MKKLFTLFSACFMAMTSVQAQCDLDFSFSNTGTNMTAFFTPPAASAIYSELGDGSVGAFFINSDGEYVCGASVAFTGSQIQLAVMADDATTPAKDGFSSGEFITWFYQSSDGAVYSLVTNPADNFVINGMSFIGSASIDAVDCGGGSSNEDACPPLETDFVNTGSNMTLFVTPGAASDLSTIGTGIVAVYFMSGDQEVCGGSSAFVGGQVQITAMGDDATTPAKDGFASGEAILWKFQDDAGNQYNLTPIPDAGFALNGISFITGMSYDAISCGVDVEGCTDAAYLEYNSSANIDDGSCSVLAVAGCTDSNYLEYNASANVDNGSCQTLIVEGCTNSLYVEYNSSATTDDGSCSALIVEGCTDVNAANFDENANVNNGSCEYDLIGAGCSVSFDATNTGANATIMVPAMDAPLNVGDAIGVFYIGEDGQAVCAGSSTWAGSNMQIVAFGDDATTPELDGLSAGDPYLMLAQSGDDVYIVSAEFSASSPNISFVINGISFVEGLSFELACTVEYLGCTDVNACNYDASANTDNGSCIYAAQNVDCSGACLNDTDADGVCDENEIVGCMDESAANYDASATDSGNCEYAGCTDSNYLEFNSDATIDDGSCSTLIIGGCTDVNATNFDASANVNDGSCEYDLIGAGCSVSFDATNTGANATIMVPGIDAPLNVGDAIGVFYIGANGQAVCAGSSTWTGSNMQIVAFGDDATTPELDGLSAGDPYLMLAQSGDDVYIVSAEFSASSPNSSFVINGISFVEGLSFELACSVEHLGCIDVDACNYDATANTDDGSCSYPEEYYNCAGSCLSDVDADGICDALELGGCTDITASNYDSSATDEDGSCISWQEAYEDCLSSGGDDGITQADVDAVQDLLDLANNSLESAISNVAMLEEQLNEALANQEDGVTQADLDVIQAQLDASVIEVSSLNNIIAGLESEVSESNSAIAALEAQIDEILANCGDDGITQADVDAVQALLDVANISITDLQSELETALANQEDGIGQDDVDNAYGQGLSDGDNGIYQVDVDAAYADGVASVIPEDGISQADVDAVQVLLNTANESNSDLQSQLDAALENQEDGITQADLDEANIQITDLQAQLEEALANGGGGSCESIYVELLQGWNIIGYTLPYPQDVAATMASIVDDVQIVKNNSAAVYWPEYAFNGIGDYIPGQGYQIRMHNAISSYTFPDVDGERLEMNPTVPAWVHDLPILNHPNDTRSLVKVVNMLGQEVNPAEQFIGEILLYLYSDGSTEKLMVE